MRQPRRDGPDNARNQPEGKGENQREHDATITSGCGNFVDGEIRGRQLRSGSRSMLRLQYPLALPGAISGTQARDTILDRRSTRSPGDAGRRRARRNFRWGITRFMPSLKKSCRLNPATNTGHGYEVMRGPRIPRGGIYTEWMKSNAWYLRRRSGLGGGRVKTCTSEERAALFSLLPLPHSGRQYLYFLN